MAGKFYDVAVIGGGPGGYAAAIRAAQLGLMVACIDASAGHDGGPALGGTCTNVGCIPSKALLHSSELYEQARDGLEVHGIGCKGVDVDLQAMMARKDQIVKQSNEGVRFLLKKNKIDFYHGHASFDKTSGEVKGYQLDIKNQKTVEKLVARQVIIATGSEPRALPGIAFDERKVLSNTGALSLKAVPKKLVLIGSGVIGLEMGSIWRRLGAEVIVLEALPIFFPALDHDIGKEALKLFGQQGLKVELGVKVDHIKDSKTRVVVSYTDAAGSVQKIKADHVIVSIGRIPYTKDLNLDGVGVAVDEKGYVVVDDACRTNIDGIWAIGDVVRGAMLAHKAQEEGVAVAERIAGQYSHIDYQVIPSVIYTVPEIAWVGETEQALQNKSIPYKVGSFPFLANGRARAVGETEGFVKILSHQQTDEVLGVHVIGAMASELIGQAVMAMTFKASAEDLARICCAHPSFSEVLKEAALATDKRALNI